jgi:hypothetical protein
VAYRNARYEIGKAISVGDNPTSLNQVDTLTELGFVWGKPRDEIWIKHFMAKKTFKDIPQPHTSTKKFRDI